MVSKRNETRFLNMVFQGGGVRGIAYAGVLETLPRYCEIHSVGGTSAGAIVASLIAIGIRGKDLKEILSDPQLFNLLEESDAARSERFKVALASASELWKHGSNSRAAMWKLGWFTWKHRHLVNDVREVWNNRGLHKSTKLRTWLDRVLMGKTFKQITVNDLKIVAADVSTREYEVYTKEKNLELPIAAAVHASVSIPIFFEPLTNGPIHLVDGGLLSNFPSFMFAQSKYPTIGFRLEDLVTTGPLNSTLAYLKALVGTMTEAHDKHRGDPPYFRAYWIKTPEHIPSTKFALTNTDIVELYQLGLAVGNTVEWNKYSSETPIITNYEPRPQETLAFSLSQARRIWNTYFKNSQNWVDSLDDETQLTVRIEFDWSTRYDRVSRLKVGGEKPLFISVFKAAGIPSYQSGVLSFMDLDHFCEEITGGKKSELTRVPAYNDPSMKGFLVFFNPPISSNQEPRTFHTGFSLTQEFAKTLALGENEAVSFLMQQTAKVHNVRLRFRILVDSDLGPMQFNPQFQSSVQEEDKIEFDQATNRTYRSYEFGEFETRVKGVTECKIEISRTPG